MEKFDPHKALEKYEAELSAMTPEERTEHEHNMMKIYLTKCPYCKEYKNCTCV